MNAALAIMLGIAYVSSPGPVNEGAANAIRTMTIQMVRNGPFVSEENPCPISSQAVVFIGAASMGSILGGGPRAARSRGNEHSGKRRSAC